MKKIWVGLIIVFILLFLSSCISPEDTSTIINGTYILEQKGKENLLPKVTISDEYISFEYDYLSSYLSHGTYTVKDGILTMITYDEKKYVFKVVRDKLIFQKNESSSVNLFDDRIGIKITDNAVFKLNKISK